MKKRKGEHVVDEGTPERKRKARDEKQSHHKSGEFARSLKGLLQKEHTRLSGELNADISNGYWPSSWFYRYSKR